MDLSSEIFFKTARSGGSGGQNVNKVETMAEAWWQIIGSHLLTDEQKEMVKDKLLNRITKEGYLIVKCSETRSQLENKHIALQKLETLVANSLIKPKPRKATKPTKASRQERLIHKKMDGLKKAMRKKLYAEND